MREKMEEKVWMAFSSGLAILAAIGMRALLRKTWKAAMHEDPPQNPADEEVPWAQALTWGALTGSVVGLARLVARREAVTVWHRMREKRAPVE